MSTLEMHANEATLEHELGLLEMARAWGPRTIARFETALRNADDDLLFRDNPISYAARTGMSEDEAIVLFLHATRAGLLAMEWNLVCESCGHLVESLSGISDLHAHYECDMCFGENEASLDDLIHVTFTVRPEVRRLRYHEPASLSVEDYYFKYRMARDIRPLPNGIVFHDVLRSWTRLLTYLEPGERRTLRLEAPLGSFYRLTDLMHRSVCALIPTSEPAETSVNIALGDRRLRVLDAQHAVAPYMLETPTFRYRYQDQCAVACGELTLEVENRATERASLWALLAPLDIHPPRLEFDNFLSGKRLAVNQTFYDLFGYDARLAAGPIRIRDVSFLFADLTQSTTLCEQLGDPLAYHEVSRYFAAFRPIVEAHAGAVLKTVGDVLVATFGTPYDAVNAAVKMMDQMETLAGGSDQRAALKIGVHRGHALAVTPDDRIDYFGQAVNVTDRIRRLAKAGELCLSQEVRDYPAVADLLDRFGAPAERADPHATGGVVMAFALAT
jgi:class 3 adenylate cyclase